MSPADLGSAIRRRRTALGLSQAQLGRLVGRSPSTVAGWESGRAAPGDDETLEALSRALGGDPGGVGDPWERDVAGEPERGRTASKAPMLTATDPSEPLPAGDPTGPVAEVSPLPAADSGPSTDGASPRTALPAPPATVVVAPNRRVARRVVRRTGGEATIGVVASVRTDVDPVYRSRAVVTAGVLVGRAIVFGWAATRAWAEVSGILEALLAPFR